VGHPGGEVVECGCHIVFRYSVIRIRDFVECGCHIIFKYSVIRIRDSEYLCSGGFPYPTVGYPGQFTRPALPKV